MRRKRVMLADQTVFGLKRRTSMAISETIQALDRNICNRPVTSRPGIGGSPSQIVSFNRGSVTGVVIRHRPTVSPGNFTISAVNFCSSPRANKGKK